MVVTAHPMANSNLVYINVSLTSCEAECLQVAYCLVAWRKDPPKIYYLSAASGLGLAADVTFKRPQTPCERAAEDAVIWNFAFHGEARAQPAKLLGQGASREIAGEKHARAAPESFTALPLTSLATFLTSRPPDGIHGRSSSMMEKDWMADPPRLKTSIHDGYPRRPPMEHPPSPLQNYLPACWCRLHFGF